tara:strand:- start:38 stop:694 length:657 start_codon:yes stop_codon:yes gene_type:complete
MSQLKLTADSGGGTVAIKGPASTTGNAALELTVPSTASDTLDSLKRAGNILQVVNTGVTSTSSLSLSSATTWYTISSLDTVITTSGANSKILINAQIFGEVNTADYVVNFKIVKVIGGTESDITNGIGATASNRWCINQVMHVGFYDNDQSSTPIQNVFAGLLDSPSQSAGTAITYRLKASINEGSSKTLYVNRSVTDNDDSSMERGISYITLMEVAV